MSYRIYGEDGEHSTDMGDEYQTLEEARAAFKEMVTIVRQDNLESNTQSPGHEWFIFYLELIEFDADGDSEWEPIELHVFAEDDENPLPKLVEYWEELNS